MPGRRALSLTWALQRGGVQRACARPGSAELLLQLAATTAFPSPFSLATRERSRTYLCPLTGNLRWELRSLLFCINLGASFFTCTGYRKPQHLSAHSCLPADTARCLWCWFCTFCSYWKLHIYPLLGKKSLNVLFKWVCVLDFMQASNLCAVFSSSRKSICFPAEIWLVLSKSVHPGGTEVMKEKCWSKPLLK